jgi:short-subunit dehydrogenase
VICNGGNSLYCSSKFALEGFTDSLRKEMLPLGVSVSLVNPGYIYTKIAEKGLAEIKHRQVPSLIQELYGRYYNNAEQRRIKNFQSGYTTEVTSEALIDAVKAPSPKTRYWVAGSGKMHASVLAFFARVVPTYLLDQIVERSTSEQ